MAAATDSANRAAGQIQRQKKDGKPILSIPVYKNRGQGGIPAETSFFQAVITTATDAQTSSFPVGQVLAT
ncbi:MAG: hypothetical protein KDA65_11115 [Planctomycetaceae bacterium]|nr:hypothetical protein [Planctomycetaceae bacterium]